MSADQVIALYGFRSKQEFIYRTNRMREITGASELIAKLFHQFSTYMKTKRLSIADDWRSNRWTGVPEGRDGAVVYEGGGNLCVLYADRDRYVRANRAFSRLVFEKAPGLGLIAAGVSVTDDFTQDFRALHTAFDRAKRQGPNTALCNALPLTKVDRRTFQPVTSRRRVGNDLMDVSRESLAKLHAYESLSPRRKREGRFIDELVENKGTDSVIAVIYCDGNAIGAKLKAATSLGDSSYPAQIDALRRFSVSVHNALVEKPLKAVRQALQELPENRRSMRVIIDHGDEITLIVNAHTVPAVLNAYFSEVEATQGYHACAGVALCHSHDPFSEVYKIAEACCESGKKRNRTTILDGGSDQSYLDFHYCRSGITGSLEKIRAAQEASVTLRPYAYRPLEEQQDVTFVDYERFGNELASSGIARSDVKNLGNIMLLEPLDGKNRNGRLEIELDRLRGKETGNTSVIDTMQKVAGNQIGKLLFDIAGFYDVWFTEVGANGDREAETDER